MTRKIVLLAAAAALAGCASTGTESSGQMVSLQRAVYVVDSANGAGADKLKSASAGEQRAVPEAGESKLMRIYWFLGGR